MSIKTSVASCRLLHRWAFDSKREILFIFWNKLSSHTDGGPTKDEKLLERHLEQAAEQNFIESVGTGLQTLLGS
jgi:hypothetical protein